jgi:ribonucleoside-diphosphate reductase alpha chain
LALKINIQCWHPQVIEFCHCKEDLNKLNRMNISVSITDKFMNAVENDENWDLIFPDYEQCKNIYDKEWNGDIDSWVENGYPIKIYQTLKAKELLKIMSECAWKTGEPAYNMQDIMNRTNSNKHLSKQVFTNP